MIVLYLALYLAEIIFFRLILMKYVEGCVNLSNIGDIYKSCEINRLLYATHSITGSSSKTLHSKSPNKENKTSERQLPSQAHK